MKAKTDFKKEGGPLSANNEVGRASRGAVCHGVCRLSRPSQAWPGGRGWAGRARGPPSLVGCRGPRQPRHTSCPQRATRAQDCHSMAS